MNILIVDDETIIREWIEYTIQSFNFEQLTTETASDGAEALDKMSVNHYDVIFIDIQMPRINGLELIENIHKSEKNVLTVILSSHSDFNYAREALRHGAFEYVLKSECSKEDLKNLIQKCMAKLSQSSAAISHLRSSYLHRIFHKKDTRESGQSPEKLFPELLNRSYCCVLLQNILSPQNVSFQSLTQEFSIDFCIFLGEMDSELYYLLPLPDHINSHGLEPFLLPLFQTFCSRYPAVLICSSRPFSSIAAIEDAVQNARNESELLFYTDTNYRISDKSPSRSTPGAVNAMDKLSTEILGYIRHFDNYNLFKSIYSLNEWILQNKPAVSSVRSTYNAILYSLCLYHCENTKTLPETAARIESAISSAAHFSQLADYVLTTVRENILSLPTAKPYSPHIESALTFIAENYSDISSVSDIADSIHLNADYLTRLFKKETGKNISSYLMQYKLNIASNMLRTTKMQVSDIAVKVGIDNISYFSKKFKEQFGMQPLSYRNTNSK